MESHVPQAWKDANIVNIYKKETEQNVVITKVHIFFLQPKMALALALALALTLALAGDVGGVGGCG